MYGHLILRHQIYTLDDIYFTIVRPLGSCNYKWAGQPHHTKRKRKVSTYFVQTAGQTEQPQGKCTRSNIHTVPKSYTSVDVILIYIRNENQNTAVASRGDRFGQRIRTESRLSLYGTFEELSTLMIACWAALMLIKFSDIAALWFNQLTSPVSMWSE